MAQHSEPASQTETRELMVSVWLGFALAVADVTVADGGDVVTIASSWLEPKNSGVGRISLAPSDLDRVAVMRTAGPTTLREAIERRAREDAFA